MHARIMVLSDAAWDTGACRWAEQILTEVSAAFGHTFSLMQGKAEEPLSEAMLEACQQCRAVFLCHGEHPAAQTLYDEFCLPLVIRSLRRPAPLCARKEPEITAYLASVLSLDAEDRTPGIEQAFAFAKEEGVTLSHVAPNGASQAPWMADIFTHGDWTTLDASAAVRALIQSPASFGLCLCPPYAGGILFAAASALYADVLLLWDAAFDGDFGVFAPVIPREDPGLFSVFSAAAAVAELLRRALGLDREADCVMATLENAMTTPAADPQAAADLICSQIAIAGVLAGRGGLTDA